MTTSDIVELVRAHTGSPGTHDTFWPGLQLIHVTAPMPRTSMVYDACVCFVAQGSKLVHIGSQSYRYDPMRYLVVSLPLPVEAEIIHATPAEPLLALVLRIDVTEVGQILLEMEQSGTPIDVQPKPGIYVSPIREELADAITRLVAAATDQTRARVLGPGMMREVLFHLLRGEQGVQLKQLALNGGAGPGVARVVRHLQQRFDEPADVENLARMAGMSASTLHRSFREVTSLTPIQYLKKVRLHRARVLMLSDGLDAGEAAYRVGYQSRSQFSREFKRLFGTTPTQAVRETRMGHLEPHTRL